MREKQLTAEYDNGAEFYGGSFAPGAAHGIGIHGTVTGGPKGALGRHVVLHVRGHGLVTLVAWLAERWPSLIRAAARALDECDAKGYRQGRDEAYMADYRAGRVVRDAISAAGAEAQIFGVEVPA